MNFVESIREELIAHSEPYKLPIMQRFFKEPVDAYCTYTEHVRRIAKERGKEFAAMSGTQRDKVTNALWNSGKFEEGAVAIQLYARRLRHCDERDWKRFETWLDRYVRNWAHCDALCADVLGPLLIRHPEWTRALPAWAGSKKTYKRRAALVAPLKGIRKGLFRKEAEALYAAVDGTSEDILKKALKWLRKELVSSSDAASTESAAARRTRSGSR
jgi:3-methyladenine DNA glycosylase AlkD